MTKRYYQLTLSAYLTILTLVVSTVVVAAAWPASLRVCIDDNAAPDIATAPVFLNSNPFSPDLLVGSTLTNGKRCNLIPIPATVVRGIDQSTTVKYVNTLGEVSAPSNALPFRLPSSPPVPVLNSVQIVTP